MRSRLVSRLKNTEKTPLHLVFAIRRVKRDACRGFSGNACSVILIAMMQCMLVAETIAQETPPSSFDDWAVSSGNVQTVGGAPNINADYVSSELYTSDVCPVQLSLGQRTWFSHGESVNHNPGPDGYPNVLSELTWKDVDSTVVEFNVDTVLHDRFVLSADVGFGGIDDGRLLDQDFLADDRQGTFSTSFSPASGDDLSYLNLDVGFRVLSRRCARGEIERYLDLFVGWQSWRESYVAHGGSGTDSMSGLFLLPDGPVIKHDLDWSSFRLGARGHFKISKTLALRSRIALVPYTECKFEDTHYLRTEMQQPGWVANVDGGWGVMFDQTVAWNVWPRLSIEVGYQVYHLNSGSGDFEVRSVDYPTAVGQFNEATMTRQGLLLAVRYQL